MQDEALRAGLQAFGSVSGVHPGEGAGADVLSVGEAAVGGAESEGGGGDAIAGGGFGARQVDGEGEEVGTDEAVVDGDEALAILAAALLEALVQQAAEGAVEGDDVGELDALDHLRRSARTSHL